jgi:hypothetical protein
MRYRHAIKFLLGAAIAILAVVVLWCVLSRHSAPALFRTLSDAEQHQVPPVADLPWENGPVGKITALHGRTVAEVAAELGEPNQTYEFSVEDGVDEFRIELLNTYPPGQARSRGVRIREWQWKYREFSVAVWFHLVDGQWVVLDTCRWKKGIVF